MRDIKGTYLAVTAVLALLGWGGFAVHDAAAQKIVCWKDKSGKVVGCGDRIPPEYQDSATKEIDAKSGMTRKTTGTAEEEAKRKAQRAGTEGQASTATLTAEEKRRLAEQQRKDAALLGTYTDEKEIDQRRDREIQAVEQQTALLRVSQKSAVARRDEARKQLEAAEKARKPSVTLKEDVARAEADIAKLDQSIAAKEKEKDVIHQRYAETKQRYMDLSGRSAQSAAVPSKK